MSNFALLVSGRFEVEHTRADIQMSSTSSSSFSWGDKTVFWLKVVATLMVAITFIADYYFEVIEVTFHRRMMDSLFGSIQELRESVWFLPTVLLVYAFRPFSLVIPSFAVNLFVLSIVDDLGYAFLLVYVGSILATMTGYWGLYAIRTIKTSILIQWVIRAFRKLFVRSGRKSYGKYLWSKYSPSLFQRVLGIFALCAHWLWRRLALCAEWLMSRMETHPVSSIIGLRVLQVPLEYPSYVAGYKQIDFSRFLIGTAIGILPGVAVLCYGLSELLALVS